MIQRSYPEEEDDIDYYYIETSETDTELSPRDKMIIEIRPEVFKINWSRDRLEIGLNITKKEYEHLKKTLKNRFKKRLIFLT